MPVSSRESSNVPLPGGEEDPDFVRALARGLAILETFDANHSAMTLSEVAERVALTRGSTRRLLLTLAELGYVGMADNRFSLRPRVLRLGYGYLSALPVWTAAKPIVESVATETGESCSVAVLDGTDIVYVVRAAARRIVNDYLAIGTRLPAYATSMGKVLLAGLSETELVNYLEVAQLQRITSATLTSPDDLRRALAAVRHDGWAVNDEEIEMDLRSIAVGIPGGQGMAAAINVSVRASRIPLERLQDYLPHLRRAASTLAELITPVGKLQRHDGDNC
jgi:IclR family transcriptional regulator, pca regulon regulatory protein